MYCLGRRACDGRREWRVVQVEDCGKPREGEERESQVSKPQIKEKN